MSRKKNNTHASGNLCQPTYNPCNTLNRLQVIRELIFAQAKPIYLNPCLNSLQVSLIYT
jgi:hypothetical protein